MKYKLLPAAETDLTESIEWYVTEKSGLEVEFLEEVELTFNQLSKKPFLYAVRHKRKAVKLRAQPWTGFPSWLCFSLTSNAIWSSSPPSGILQEILRSGRKELPDFCNNQKARIPPGFCYFINDTRPIVVVVGRSYASLNFDQR